MGSPIRNKFSGWNNLYLTGDLIGLGFAIRRVISFEIALPIAVVGIGVAGIALATNTVSCSIGNRLQMNIGYACSVF